MGVLYRQSTATLSSFGAAPRSSRGSQRNSQNRTCIDNRSGNSNHVDRHKVCTIVAFAHRPALGARGGVTNVRVQSRVAPAVSVAPMGRRSHCVALSWGWSCLGAAWEPRRNLGYIFHPTNRGWQRRLVRRPYWDIRNVIRWSGRQGEIAYVGDGRQGDIVDVRNFTSSTFGTVTSSTLGIVCPRTVASASTIQRESTIWRAALPCTRCWI